MISYNNKEIIFKGCPGCAYGKHEFNLECGMAYENDRFTLSQDWELPIQGFFIVSPKRHIEKLCELTKDERNEMFEIVDKTVKILRDNKICEREAPTTPLPFTISSPTNSAFGKKWDKIPSIKIKINIIENAVKKPFLFFLTTFVTFTTSLL